MFNAVTSNPKMCKDSIDTISQLIDVTEKYGGIGDAPPTAIVFLLVACSCLISAVISPFIKR